MKTVSLHIEASCVRAVVSNGKRISRWASLTLEPGIVRDGMILDTVRLGASIGAFLEQEGMAGLRVISSLGGVRCMPRTMTLPGIKTSLLDDAVRYQAEREMPIPIEGLYLPWALLQDTGSDRQVFAIGVAKGLLDEAVVALDLAGIKNKTIDLKALALARAVGGTEAVIVDIEADQLDVILMADGVPLIMRTVHWETEELTPEAMVKQAASEVNRTIDYYNSGEPEFPIAETTPVFLTGGLASHPVVPKLLGEALANPLGEIESALRWPAEFPAAEYAVNVGMAVKVSSGKRGKKHTASKALNLTVEPDGIQRRRFSPRVAILVTLAVLVTAPLYLSYQANQSVSDTLVDLEVRLAAVQAQVREARSSIAPVGELVEEAESLERDAKIILETSSSYADALAMFSQSLPTGAALTSIDLAHGDASISGSAIDRVASIEYAARLEETDSFSKVHIAALTVAVEEDGSMGLAQFRILAER